MVGLMGEGKAVAVKPLLHRRQRQAVPPQSEQPEQLFQGDAVLDRHRCTAMQHDGHPCRCQGQRHQGQQRRRTAAAVVGDTEAEGAPPRGLQRRAMEAITVEHAAQLQRHRPTDAMGDQESAELGLADLGAEHQVHRLAGLLATEAGAGVLTAAHLAKELPEPQPGRRHCGLGTVHR